MIGLTGLWSAVQIAVRADQEGGGIARDDKRGIVVNAAPQTGHPFGTALRTTASAVLHAIVFGVALGTAGLTANALACFAFEWENEKFTAEQAFELNSAVLLIFVSVASVAYLVFGALSLALTRQRVPPRKYTLAGVLGPTAFFVAQLFSTLGGEVQLVAYVVLPAACAVLTLGRR